MGERITGRGYWSLHWYDVCVFGEWKVRNMKLHEMVVCSLGFSIDWYYTTLKLCGYYRNGT